jgi:hypothetical protein
MGLSARHTEHCGVESEHKVSTKNRLSPEELGLLAKQLAAAADPAEAARIRERLTRGFYGI